MEVLTLRACLRGGGGHLVGEVTRLGGVKNNPSLHTCIHTYTHTYTHTYIHTYIHTYTLFMLEIYRVAVELIYKLKYAILQFRYYL